MDMELLLQQIFEVCIIPLLGILTKFAVEYLVAKRDEAKANTDSATTRKYIDMLYSTVADCVVATNQTYVSALKDKDIFDESAQKAAFELTFDAVLNVLNKDTKDYLNNLTGDINLYITQLIEAEIGKSKK